MPNLMGQHHTAVAQIAQRVATGGKLIDPKITSIGPVGAAPRIVGIGSTAIGLTAIIVGEQHGRIVGIGIIAGRSIANPGKDDIGNVGPRL